MEKEVGNRETAVVVVVMVKVRGNLLWSASHLTTQNTASTLPVQIRIVSNACLSKRISLKKTANLFN